MSTDKVISHCEHLQEHFYVGSDAWRPGRVTRECLRISDCPWCERSVMLDEIYAVWSRAGRSSELGKAIYALQDGYGVTGYVPPQGRDWTGIRDSSIGALRSIYALIHA